MPNSPTPNVFGYNAEATDYSTGLQYLRARYYDTNIGRFTQEDTYRGNVLRPESMNRYAYAHSNPIRYSDPSGYFGVISAIFGGTKGERQGALVGGLITTAILVASTVLITATGIFGVIISAIIGSLASGLGDFVSQYVAAKVDGKEFNLDATSKDVHSKGLLISNTCPSKNCSSLYSVFISTI